MVHAGLEGPSERQKLAGSTCQPVANRGAPECRRNKVEFEYRPTLFRILMILNRITMVLLVSFLIFAFVRIRWRSGKAQKSGIIANREALEFL
jgi:hypothetical protein